MVEEILAKYITPEGELDCEALIPYPQVYKDLDEAAAKIPFSTPDRPKDGFNSGGYEWCVIHWGTKWGTYSGNGVRERGPSHPCNARLRNVKLTFQSAWSPPSPAIAELASLYPDVEFNARSYERGQEYKFIQDYDEGQLVREEKSVYRGRRGG